MVQHHNGLPYVAGVLDSTGVRLCTYNGDGTWVGVRGQDVFKKWVPKGYDLADTATQGAMSILRAPPPTEGEKGTQTIS